MLVHYFEESLNFIHEKLELLQQKPFPLIGLLHHVSLIAIWLQSDLSPLSLLADSSLQSKGNVPLIQLGKSLCRICNAVLPASIGEFNQSGTHRDRQFIGIKPFANLIVAPISDGECESKIYIFRLINLANTMAKVLLYILLIRCNLFFRNSTFLLRNRGILNASVMLRRYCWMVK